MTPHIDFGWVLLLAGLAGLIPTLRALLRTRRLTRVRTLRLIVNALLILLGALEIQRHHDWRPLNQSAPAASTQAAAARPSLA